MDHQPVIGIIASGENCHIRGALCIAGKRFYAARLHFFSIGYLNNAIISKAGYNLALRAPICSDARSGFAFARRNAQ